MSIDSKIPKIVMELYETDVDILQKFISTEKIDGEFTEKYLILYNFAEDCKYAKKIQPDLIEYLIPFYVKTMEQAVIYGNKAAIDIYFEFNKVLFLNQESFRLAVGEANYQDIMEYYIKQTIREMEMTDFGILDWVSQFNTTIAFGVENIRRLFEEIFAGSLQTKYSFLRYISVLLFGERDNILAVDETRDFWTSNIWNFDDEYFGKIFFWSDEAVAFYEKEIDRERIENLFIEVKPLLYEAYDSEVVELFGEEMNKSFETGVFIKRKTEFLKKISCKEDREFYWDHTF